MGSRWSRRADVGVPQATPLVDQVPDQLPRLAASAGDGRVADDEIAVATLLGCTGAWSRGEGPAPYPLAEACQDHMLALAIDDSLASGGTVRTARQVWAS